MVLLRKNDIEEIFCRSSGPGGQHVNKVSTAVTLRHIPSGIFVTVTDTRSQAQNRTLARQRLVEKITALQQKKKQSQLAEVSRNRRRRAKRSRKTKANMVESKRHRGETKKLRGKVVL